MRREDTARTRIKVVEPLVGDWRVTQILNPCSLLPCPLVCRVFFKRRSRVLSHGRASCAWSCGALSRLFRGEANVGSEWSSSSVRVKPLCSISGTVGFAVCPCIACCHESFAAWAAACWYSLAMGFSELSGASTKAAVATRRTKRGCAGKTPPDVAPRVMSRMRGLAAMKALRCAGRATSIARL